MNIFLPLSIVGYKNYTLQKKQKAVLFTCMEKGLGQGYAIKADRNMPIMKDRILNAAQNMGRSFILPIVILPIAGLFLGIGQSMTNPAMIHLYHLQSLLGNGTILHAIFMIMRNAGSIVFDNLPLLFAMAVALGFAKKEKEVAVLAAAISFLVMHSAIGTMLTITDAAKSMPKGSVVDVLGITTLQMGVFGGVIVGMGTAMLHNHFYKIQLPSVVSYFGGNRFVPIICSIVYLFVGVCMFYIWPYLQDGIFAIGSVVRNTGYFGTFLYGVSERALIPFGLHHIFYLPFWQTGVGGSMVIAGKTVEGAQNIFFAQLADPNTTQFSYEATRFMSGKFPLMIFGLPGAALAMYRCAKPKKRKLIAGLLISAALTSMLTGITEPLEYTFLFVAPLLYVIHCILAGLSYMLMHMLHVGVGMTFSGGLIDLFLFGILQGNAKTNWIMIVVVGVVYFFVYYFLFCFLIRKLNLKTPGREDDDEDVKLYTKNDYIEKQNVQKTAENTARSSLICKGLGGRENIVSLNCCVTRLHVTLHDTTKIDEILLQASGALGLYRKRSGVLLVYGPRVTIIKSNLEEYMNHESDCMKSE